MELMERSGGLWGCSSHQVVREGNTERPSFPAVQLPSHHVAHLIKGERNSPPALN
eukprot:COSAG01_NODE_6445_length_3661_cov_61.874509_5_plen_55_part_00